METTARIGMVNYINTAPIYEPWLDSVHRPDWQVVEAPPATLNKLLAAAQLDLGFVSSYEYCKRPEGYRILADLSISADGPVGSVFLFSRCPLADLDAAQVLLSSQSETSVALVRIILEDFIGVKPCFVGGEIGGIDHAPFQAILAIGDDALRLSAEGQFPHRFDLGEIWKDHTGLPFVFAVFAVREEFCRQSPLILEEVHRQLLRCHQQGMTQLGAISARVASRIPMAVALCEEYLSGIKYDLNVAKQQALAAFCVLLIRRGEASPAALPLKVHPAPR